MSWKRQSEESQTKGLSAVMASSQRLLSNDRSQSRVGESKENMREHTCSR